MNIDTDLQYAFLAGVRDYVQDKKDYLQAQIGNPNGADEPNKKSYDLGFGYVKVRNPL